MVSAHIKHHVWPELRRLGFSNFSERSAWRYDGPAVHVVNFQSFSSYLAERVEVTTFSFSLNIGAFFQCFPPTSGPAAFPKSGALKPKAPECHFRGTLERTFSQREIDRRDIWYIDPAGSNLEQSVSDALAVLLARGVPWFQSFGAPEPALEFLLSGARDMLEGRVWGFGNPGSPSHDYKVGYLALHLGRAEVALPHLRRAASFFKANSQLAEDVERCT